jgi:hypothetical protein
MLCDPAPFGRGSERLVIGQRVGGLGYIPASVSSFHEQWRTPGAWPTLLKLRIGDCGLRIVKTTFSFFNPQSAVSSLVVRHCCMSSSYEKSGAATLLGLKMTNDE